MGVAAHPGGMGGPSEPSDVCVGPELLRRRQRMKATTPQITTAATAAPIRPHAQPGRPLASELAFSLAVAAPTAPAAATAVTAATAESSALVVAVVVVAVVVVAAAVVVAATVVVAGGAVTVSVSTTVRAGVVTVSVWVRVSVTVVVCVTVASCVVVSGVVAVNVTESSDTGAVSVDCVVVGSDVVGDDGMVAVPGGDTGVDWVRLRPTVSVRVRVTPPPEPEPQPARRSADSHTAVTPTTAPLRRRGGSPARCSREAKRRLPFMWLPAQQEVRQVMELDSELTRACTHSPRRPDRRWPCSVNHERERDQAG